MEELVWTKHGLREFTVNSTVMNCRAPHCFSGDMPSKIRVKGSLYVCFVRVKQKVEDR